MRYGSLVRMREVWGLEGVVAFVAALLWLYGVVFPLFVFTLQGPAKEIVEVKYSQDAEVAL